MTLRDRDDSTDVLADGSSPQLMRSSVGGRLSAGLRKLRSGPLGRRNFALLVTCDVASVAGTSIATVATPFAVLQIGGRGSDLGYVSAAASVPMLLFLLVGGVVADRIPRQRMLALANVIQAAAQSVAAALLLSGTANVAWLVGLTAFRGFGVGLYLPAASGLVPQTVPAEQLPEANAISRVCRALAQIGGAGLGGVLVAAVRPGWGLAADAASYILAGSLRGAMRFRAAPAAKKRGAFADLRDGWRAFVSRRWLWVIVLQIACVTAAYQATTGVLGPLVAHDELGGARSWGLITAATSVGGLFGGLVMLRYHPRRILLTASLSCLLLSVLMFALAAPLPLVIIVVAAFLGGAGIEFFVVNEALAIQQEIPPDMLSRVFAYDALGSYALAPLGILIAGPLAASFSVGSILVGCGAVVVSLTLVAQCVPEIRRLKRRTIAPAADQTG